jgi:two-component system, LuxR family, response regulator FixJ
VDVSTEISIVDDDPSVCRAVARLIESFGFTAHTHSSAEAFLASSDAQHVRCLILDVQLPGIDGLELQRQLARVNPTVRVIFLTAHSARMRLRAMNAGAVDVLSKPFNEQALLRNVYTALEMMQPG